MASIATGSIAERTSLDTYVFYTFMTSSLIFPLALAWCWEDGWLSSIGFNDYAGAGIVHLTGGITGFIGTYLCGPRIGLFSKDKQYLYMLDEENFAFDHDADSDSFESLDETGNTKSQSTIASNENEAQEQRRRLQAFMTGRTDLKNLRTFGKMSEDESRQQQIEVAGQDNTTIQKSPRSICYCEITVA